MEWQQSPVIVLQFAILSANGLKMLTARSPVIKYVSIYFFYLLLALFILDTFISSNSMPKANDDDNAKRTLLRNLWIHYIINDL